MNALIRAEADLQAVCEAHQWRCCFIGGLAVLRWGEPRETIDVDLTLITGFGGERAFVSALLEAFEPRIDDAAAFAERNRVLLLRASSGVSRWAVCPSRSWRWIGPRDSPIPRMSHCAPARPRI